MVKLHIMWGSMWLFPDFLKLKQQLQAIIWVGYVLNPFAANLSKSTYLHSCFCWKKYGNRYLFPCKRKCSMGKIILWEKSLTSKVKVQYPLCICSFCAPFFCSFLILKKMFGKSYPELPQMHYLILISLLHLQYYKNIVYLLSSSTLVKIKCRTS